MKITKYEHACVVLEKAGKKLVIDPGEYTTLPNDLSDVCAIVITHVHGDHVDPNNIKKIVDANSKVKIFALEDAMSVLLGIDADKQTIENSGKFSIDGFELELIIHDHAIVYEVVPCQNMGVVVDNSFYYPGDSFHVIGQELTCVALPISGPWMKLGESIEFAKAMKASKFVATHDAHISEIGISSAETWFARIFAEQNKALIVLKPSDSVDI